MRSLRELIESADVLSAMHPSELAGYLLECLIASGNRPGSGLWHRSNFNRTVGSWYRDQHGQLNDAVLRSCAEAWEWLEVNLLICRMPEDENGWYMPTRRGIAARDRAGLSALIAAEELPEHFLHSDLLSDVRPLYLQGRYDLAVFEAFHKLEVAIRTVAGLGTDLIGTRLTARAFNPEDGPLTDKQAEAGERQALMNLMSGAIGSYKNPQSHRHVGLDSIEARDMLMIASHLLKIVDSRR
jgi:uncharacterized protein (TIGR02391 family)